MAARNRFATIPERMLLFRMPHYSVLRTSTATTLRVRTRSLFVKVPPLGGFTCLRMLRDKLHICPEPSRRSAMPVWEWFSLGFIPLLHFWLFQGSESFSSSSVQRAESSCPQHCSPVARVNDFLFNPCSVSQWQSSKSRSCIQIKCSRVRQDVISLLEG